MNTAQATKKVGLLNFEAVSQGLVGQTLGDFAKAGVSLVVADACDDAHLLSIARGAVEMPLITGGSGIARFLPEAWRDAGLINADDDADDSSFVDGRAAILAGSCSRATNRQVAHMKSQDDVCASFAIQVEELMADFDSVFEQYHRQLRAVPEDQIVMVYSTSEPEQVAELQAKFGTEQVAHCVESFLARIAELLVQELGVRRLVLAGGETSGAVTKQLGVKSIRIGPEICPGVPWTQTIQETPLALVLKSGNFGDDQFKVNHGSSKGKRK